MPPTEGMVPPTPGRGWTSNHTAIAVVVAAAAIAGALFWLGSRQGEESSSPTTSTTTVASSSTTAETTTSAPTTSAPTTPPSSASPPPSPPSGVEIGLEWVNDGRAAAPGFEEITGSVVANTDDIAFLMYGPDGYELWLTRIIGYEGDHARLRLIDIEPAPDMTETDVWVMGSTSCSSAGTPIDGVVAVFTYTDTAQLTSLRSAWQVDAASGTFVPLGGPVACENEGWGV